MKLFTQSNSWELVDEKELSATTCSTTNSARSDSPCKQCSLATSYQHGLSLTINNHVTFVQNGQLVRFPILNKNQFGNKEEPSYVGTSLVDVFRGSTHTPPSPPSDELLLEGFGEKAAVGNSYTYMAVSAPDSGREGKGAILFYHWNTNTERWDFDERDDGTVSDQHLGSKRLQFVSENTLEVVSNEEIYTYFVNSLVSWIQHILFDIRIISLTFSYCFRTSAHFTLPHKTQQT